MTAADPLADALAAHRAGRPDMAIPAYRRLLATDPENPDLRHLLALALHGVDLAAAHAEMRRTLALAPSTSLYLHNAARLAGSDELRHARLLARALALDPAPAEAQHRLGALMARSRRHGPAAAQFRRTLALDPGFTFALFDRAALDAETGRTRRAIAGYRRLLSVAASADVLGTLGAALAAAGDGDDALRSFRRSLALAPGSAEAWHAYGAALANDPASSEAAIVAAGRALRISPEASDPHLTLAHAFFHQGRIRDAVRARRRVLALNPGDAQAHWNFLPSLHLDPDLAPEEQFAYRQRVHRRFSDPLTRSAPAHRNTPDPDRRLRIGYVDDRMLNRSTHSIILLPIIEAHDPKEVALHFYTNLPEAMADDMTGRYRATSAGFRHTDGLVDRQVADLVRADGIDILVDVSGHLTGARTGVFAARPAPIQVTLLQVGSSGLAAMDYAVADPAFFPTDRPSFFTETILPTPTSYIFEAPTDLVPPLALGHPDRPPTFGSLNLLAKSGEPVLALWAKVLERVPGSRLLIKAAGLASPAVRRRLLAFFEARGIAPGRLELRAWTDGYTDHLATFEEIDVVLDCFPYPGITTSLEALLMGVPVVTLAGDRFVSRFGEAIIKTVGHPDWIARDADDYVAIAAALAGDRQRLATLKRRLRGELMASPFAQPGRFTRSLEAAFRQAWRQWCRERPREIPSGSGR